MTIEAKVIADSYGHDAPRITTFQLKYPRFIHAEFMTHRMFSRNASSSRAIPVERQIDAIIEDTAMPVHWGKNQKGMQADGENDAPVYGVCGKLDMVENTMDGVSAQEAWEYARDRAVEAAKAFHHAGYHKQVVNRILEPFSHINVVVTATNYDNFFALRRHPDAQPEIKVLADRMYMARKLSTPKLLGRDEWHLPYVTEQESAQITQSDGQKYIDVGGPLPALIGVSVARCARVSYMSHDGRPTTLAEDMALYERLVGSVPLHASPAEHQATPDRMIWSEHGLKIPADPALSGNFDTGWIQFRKLLDAEFTPTGAYP